MNHTYRRQRYSGAILRVNIHMRSIDTNTAIAVAREVMLQLFIDGKHQQAKGAECVWNSLIVARNTAQPRECDPNNAIKFPVENV